MILCFVSPAHGSCAYCDTCALRPPLGLRISSTHEGPLPRNPMKDSRKKRIMSTCVTAEQHTVICAKAEAAGMSRAAFLRGCALGQSVRRRAGEETQRMVLRLGRQIQALGDEPGHRKALATVRQLAKALRAPDT